MSATTIKTGNAAPERPFLLHLALSAISIAQPFYSVTGKDLNFFVAWRMSGVEFTCLILLIYLAPPVITYSLVSIGSRLNRSLGRALSFAVFWLYISLAFLIAAQQQAHDILPTLNDAVMLSIGAVLLIVSAGLAWLLFAKAKVREFLQFFSALTLVFPALMLLRGYDVGVIQFSQVPPAEKIKAENPPNVILIIYDELPVTTILDANGLIDRKKFPNFYQFAQGATWFANARSLSGHTESAVPSILAGRLRKDGTPATYKSYPNNIFYTLGPSYNVLDLQILTDLNPTKQPGDEANPLSRDEKWGKIASDVAIIFAHTVAPPQLIRDIPRIDTQLNRFGEDVLNSSHGVRHHDKFVAALEHARQPFLAVYHNIYPHNRWSHYPSGRPYPDPKWGDYISLIDRKDALLSSDVARIMHDYQGHLLQSMHADKLLGDLLTHLKRNGQYDHSIIAVVADHGVALWPGESPRYPSESRWLDVAAIPLIIKLPGQTQGGISLDWVLTRDIYPAILEYLGAPNPKDLQGQSLLATIRQSLPTEKVESTPYRDSPSVKRRIEWFGTGTSMADLYGFGRFRGYLGHNVNEFDLTETPEIVAHLFRTDGSRHGTRLSARIDGQIKGGAQNSKAQDILVALGDRICGASRTSDLEVSGQADSFTLIIAEDCLELLNRDPIRIFVAGSFGNLAELSVEGGPPKRTAVSINRVLDQLAEFSGSLEKVQDSAQRKVNLQELRELGVAVPKSFEEDDRLRWPWGDLVLTQNGREWVLDLYSAPKDLCKAILLGAERIPGAARVATSAAAKDEASVPVTAGHAEAVCANEESEMIRIILRGSERSGHSSARPPTDQLLEKLTEFIGGLNKTYEGTQGPMTPQALWKLGITVPEMFVRDRRLAWPWGEAGLTRNGQEWVLDLHSAPRNVCEAVQLAVNEIPGVARVATTGLAKDEAPIPVTTEHAKATCSRAEADVIRIITADARAGATSVPPPLTDQLLEQLAAFIGGLSKVSENTQRQVNLQALREFGVAVPGIFVRNQKLAWPWGEVALMRSGREWILDLHSAPKDVCKAVQLAASGIPGVARVATSGLAKDEKSIPVTAEHVEASCANSDVIRIITTGGTS
jgi:hypothetical protein